MPCQVSAFAIQESCQVLCCNSLVSNDLRARGPRKSLIYKALPIHCVNHLPLLSKCAFSSKAMVENQIKSIVAGIHVVSFVILWLLLLVVDSQGFTLPEESSSSIHGAFRHTPNCLEAIFLQRFIILPKDTCFRCLKIAFIASKLTTSTILCGRDDCNGYFFHGVDLVKVFITERRERLGCSQSSLRQCDLRSPEGH